MWSGRLFRRREKTAAEIVRTLPGGHDVAWWRNRIGRRVVISAADPQSGFVDRTLMEVVIVEAEAAAAALGIVRLEPVERQAVEWDSRWFFVADLRVILLRPA